MVYIWMSLFPLHQNSHQMRTTYQGLLFILCCEVFAMLPSLCSSQPFLFMATMIPASPKSLPCFPINGQELSLLKKKKMFWNWFMGVTEKNMLSIQYVLKMSSLCNYHVKWLIKRRLWNCIKTSLSWWIYPIMF